ncbi:cytochrome c biogenesis protein CcsA [Cytophaga hutchinsonii]|uniref:Cytochrome c-type biogenesis protein n=1 Tax=Cytophaga hutchinsonii (strain ATCC 33406 / DSM 1761 / CIP 103989 / NBRC 15051 / NCIMB 9469 / D465) TaxID=269798 RepID=A0A6N4SVT4_CYTH3|nr:cytochrome c biogenesis protein CcsA [Cytophaga hutchinsonii]ABG60482.1 cytochrome c-type biogenesis protein [Cytophaga hutchinsonii ATCC 33406]SFX85000.1 cytochrome c-type biogenesis protein CcmF [Cytophaga hutchinsonii ATCC 33406]
MDLLIGDYGHLFVITSFFAAILASYGYYEASKENQSGKQSWLMFSRIAFGVHALSVVGVVATLFAIIYNHRYEYHYAWSHSSNHLPVYYMISCFWEGQEGSFLLWIFWHAVLGTILIKVNNKWEAPVMSVFMLVQAFLASMIIGIVLPYLNTKIGSSPFILMKDAMPDLPVYNVRPDFIAEDGNGLNPLLQNYWMVIHPPTLFLGFAATIVPFAYCMAGLWKGWTKEWIRPALPWALFAAVILGTGIMMGAYWAYETLNFGGYWNWDPVENAVYVPWLILIASLHLMISYKNSGTALRMAVIMVTLSFLLILYATFLTRSGILGNSSVHSFTDLGLSGQLLIYLLTFTFLAGGLIIKSWKKIPFDQEEPSAYSREFWIFIGVAVLSLAAFQVLAMTSMPVYNTIAKSFGIELDAAPPSSPETFYSYWQMGFAIFIAILSGMGQFFWWKKMDKKQLWDALYLPIIVALGCTCVIILTGLLDAYTGEEIHYLVKTAYILLVAASLFSIFSNIMIFVKVVRNNYRITGGALAHIGVAMMLIGILFSSGYSRIVSLNNTGLLYSKEFTDDVNRDNLLLFRNAPEKMKDMQLIYKGQRIEVNGYGGYVNKDWTFPTQDPYKVIIRKDLKDKDVLVFKKGDTLTTNPENTFYEVAYVKAAGDTFTLYPRIQQNPRMGNVVSPDIKHFLSRDLYSHLSAIPLEADERDWSEVETHTIKQGDTIYINDYVCIFKHVDVIKNVPGVALGEDDFSVVAHMLLLGPDGAAYPMHPNLVILAQESASGAIPELNEELGVKISLEKIKPESHEFVFNVQTCQKDYIIIKAIEKPGINLLWIGTLLVILGLGMAMFRRYKEFVAMRNKGQEVI